MAYKKILTIQDISCVGQCSMTVALPILSVCGVETCVLPSAVLSTHTSGFKNYTFRDLTDDIPKIRKHWQSEGIFFDGIYTGYLGSEKQIEYVSDIIDTMRNENSVAIVDPAMADNGKLYPAFGKSYVEAMKKLCFDKADIIVPNITETCMLTGVEYKEVYDETYIQLLLKGLLCAGAKTVVMTGVGYNAEETGVVVAEMGDVRYYSHPRMEMNCHGTGDVFASAFAGALMSGKDTYSAVKIAADYTLSCIKMTMDDEKHWYGVKFEKALPELVKMLSENREEDV